MSRCARRSAAEELAQVLRVRSAGDHRADHEGVVDDLAEAELLGKIVRPAEQGAGRQLAFDQQLHAAEQHAVVERQVDLVGRHVLFERLDGRVVAAGLEADRDRHARQILWRFHLRVRRHEDARRCDRIDIGVELAVPARSPRRSRSSGRRSSRPTCGLPRTTDRRRPCRPCRGPCRRSPAPPRGIRSRGLRP